MSISSGLVVNNPKDLFPSEEKMRENRMKFRQYCFEILDKRQLPLANLAFALYLNTVDNSDKDMRKDGITPREQHEESHVVTLDALLDTVGSEWINAEEYGSEDTLFAATILHDMIEDFNLSPKAIRTFLQDGIANMYKAAHFNADHLPQLGIDIEQTVEIVKLLSRKDQHGKKFADDDRVLNAKKWLEHPFAYVIKTIDWSNKLQTMVGVAHFEDNDQKKMGKVIDETSFLFVNEQQALTKRAIEQYPFLKPVCAPMEGVMGMLFQTLNTYKKIRTGSFPFNPETAYSFDFDDYLQAAKPLLTKLPRGNNYIDPLLVRLKSVAQEDSRISPFIENMIKPAFKSQKDIVSIFPPLNPFRPPNQAIA